MSLSAPREARAQSAKASAEALFAEGRRLMGENKLEEACPKFADSQKLDPSSSTLLNLANCYEKAGRAASAWATYQEAASLASATGRADHLQIAQKRATAIGPTLAHATVTVERPAPGIEIKRDGVPVLKAEWGLAVPIDPGPHTYVAVAPDYKETTVQMTVPATPEGGAPPKVTVIIPALEKLPPKPVLTPVVPPVDPKVAAGWRPQRTWALVIGGVGVAGLAASIGFTVAANAKYHASLAMCRPTDKSLCSIDGVNTRNDAIAQGNTATGTLVGGAVGVALGTVLWLTAAPPAAPGAQSSALEFSAAPGGMMVRGRW
jgi:hypothetical protein